MGMEASFAYLVRRSLDCRWTCLHRRCRRQLHRARGRHRQSTLALPVRSLGVLFADDLFRQRQAIRGRSRRRHPVHFWLALKFAESSTITFVAADVESGRPIPVGYSMFVSALWDAFKHPGVTRTPPPHSTIPAARCTRSI